MSAVALGVCSRFESGYSGFLFGSRGRGGCPFRWGAGRRGSTERPERRSPRERDARIAAEQRHRQAIAEQEERHRAEVARLSGQIETARFLLEEARREPAPAP